MSNKKINISLLILLVAILICSILLTNYGINTYKTKSAKIIATKLEIEELSAKRERTISQKNELSKNQSSIELLEKIVPKNKDQALAIAEILKIAEENNIEIGSFSFPSSELGKNISTAKDASSQKVTQTKPVEGINGLYAIETTLSNFNGEGLPSGSGISYNQLLSVLNAIEKNRRTMQISSIQIQPVFKANQISGYSPTLTINLFVKP